MIKDVRLWSFGKPKDGITENHRGYPSEGNIRVFGGDTETVRGVPYTLQLAGPPLTMGPLSREREMISRVTPKTIFQVMMEWLISRSIKGGINLCFFHNLNFDLRSLFHLNLRSFYDQYNDIKLERDGYVCKILFGRVNHAQIWEDLGGYVCPMCKHNGIESVPEEATEIVETDNGKKRVCTRHTRSEPSVRRNLGAKITLMDSAAFCPPGGKSLEAALKIYDVPHQKMKKPDGLGEKKLWTPYFREYALNDARVEQALGEAIVRLHKDYDVTPAVSLPHLASRIFRHHFFKAGETLKYPPEPCRTAAEFSYHAGKNGLYVQRGIYENCYEYDINSAFPKAMQALPQMVCGRFQKTKIFQRSLPGLYLISGSARHVRIPAIFNHNFVPIKEGEFRRVWVTGFEIECLKQAPAYKFKIKTGWVWKPQGGGEGPLARFVDHFWEKKSTAPKGPKRDTYKNILNSLYGKFAACVEKRPVVETAFGPQTVCDPADGAGKHFVAGALYHPFIATQITGYVRRELYNWETKGHALHSATDSIKTLKKLPTSNELGGLKEEVYGRCYLFRTKLYLHFAKDNSRCGHDLSRGWIKDRHSGGSLMAIFDGGQHLCKYALHGFKGTVKELFERRFELLKTGHLDYDYDHMVNLREGIKRNEPISTMIKRRERLQLVDNTDENEKSLDKAAFKGVFSRELMEN